ncbi:MAG: SnoaL-like domain-containing protein [Saprospiraceae bacterium]
MTTQEVANRLVELCREGKYEQAVKELYSPEIISVEPEGMPNRIVKGIEGVAEKSAKFEAMLEKVNTSFISDPLVAENFFSCTMLMNVQFKGAPAAIDMDEVCVYNVKEGKIVREEFFYTPQPQEA